MRAGGLWRCSRTSTNFLVSTKPRKYHLPVVSQDIVRAKLFEASFAEKSRYSLLRLVDRVTGTCKPFITTPQFGFEKRLPACCQVAFCCETMLVIVCRRQLQSARDDVTIAPCFPAQVLLLARDAHVELHPGVENVREGHRHPWPGVPRHVARESRGHIVLRTPPPRRSALQDWPLLRAMQSGLRLVGLERLDPLSPHPKARQAKGAHHPDQVLVWCIAKKFKSGWFCWIVDSPVMRLLRCTWQQFTDASYRTLLPQGRLLHSPWSVVTSDRCSSEICVFRFKSLVLLVFKTIRWKYLLPVNLNLNVLV